MATALDPRKGRGNALKKKKKQAKKISPSESRKSFLLNKIMVHQLQNSRGRLVLQLTTEQPRKACFTTNYKTTEADLLQNLLIKGRRLVVMVDSQSCSSNYQARALGASDEEEEEVGAPELVSTC